MKRILFAILLVLVFAIVVSAQDATSEPAVPTLEAAPVEAPAVEPTPIYIETMPAWVLPVIAILLATIGLQAYANYRQGIHLKDMISEKAFATLIGIVRDVAKDIAASTPNKIDDALVKGLLPDEPAPTANVINVNVPGVG